MPIRTFYQIMALVLLGAGIFQIIAALVAIFFWLMTGDWRDLLLQIMVISFWITLPVVYLIRHPSTGKAKK